MVPSRLSLTTGGRFTDPIADSQRDRRERANATCIGGLRDPGKSLQKLPLWYGVGTRVSEALDEVLRNHEAEVAEMIHLIGQPEASEPAAVLVRAAREAVATCLRVGSFDGTGVWAQALAARVAEAGDHEVARA